MIAMLAILLFLPMVMGAMRCCCGGIQDDCTSCDGTVPAFMQVDISGVAASACSSGQCSAIDGTYLPPFNDAFAVCIWRIDPPSPSTCQVERVNVTFGAPPPLTVSFRVVSTVTDQIAEFQTGDFSLPLDCLSLSSEATSYNGSVGNSQCDFSGATVTLTSIP